ncbi:MAG: hypothetical protein PHC60_03090 [Heliobacteriaceae bacterium]|nr:hypothetical protein [Heliobacteriaceae bacterium]MDD4587365.1 hypothetical protein [Heliobacteriaceae bacterium]
MIQSKVLFGWEFDFSGRADFWNGIGKFDYSLRYVDQTGRVQEVGFKEIFALAEYVREQNVVFGPLQREVYPPCAVALTNYVYQYFANEVLLKSRRSLGNPWTCQYEAVDRGKINCPRQR